MPPTSTSPIPTKTNLVVAYKVATHLLLLLILVQAVMAGQIVYEEELQTIHGILGNISFLLGVASLVLAVVCRAPKTAIGVAGVVVLLLVVQIALGYSAGHLTASEETAGAWHIPNGVLLFGLSLWQVTLVRRMATSE